MADVDPALGHGDGQPAAAVAQVGNHHQGQVGLDGVLGEDVHARHAQVAAAFLHLDHDVGRPHEDDVEAAVADDRRLVLPVAGPADLVAGRLQELDDPVVEVALRGDRQPDRVDCVRCSFAEISWFEASTRSRVCSLPVGRPVADLGQPLQPEREPDAAVVAVAAQHAGQAVVAAAAADLDRARGRRDHQLEDHLGVEADPPAEAEVELDPARFDAVLRQAA